MSKKPNNRVAAPVTDGTWDVCSQARAKARSSHTTPTENNATQDA